MTWSILARDPQTGAFGVAITTKAFAVGVLCPHIVPGRGVLATQATTNPLYGPDGSHLLAQGVPAAEVVRRLTIADPGASRRQLHVLDAAGRIAQHTGEETVPWAGAVSAPWVSVAGNMLAGPQVVAATLECYLASSHLPFAERLITALDAGEAAGGDKRGRQSAALRVQEDQPYPVVDLRVDDHDWPLVELRRLYRVALTSHIPLYRHRARTDAPAGTLDRAVMDRVVAAALSTQSEPLPESATQV